MYRDHMTNYNEELNALIRGGFLPNNQYLSTPRFTPPYQNTRELFQGVGLIACWPILNGISVCIHAMKAVWAALRAIGNMLILKPSHTVNALKEVCFHSMLTVALAVMAPIHALTYSLELLTRTISSWFTEEESVADLSKLNYAAKSFEETQKYKSLLPSSNYFKGSRFFSPYQDALQCLGQLAAPATSGISSGLGSLYQAVYAVSSAISCIMNIAICKPKHALEDLRDCSIHTSISLSLALMAPVNALVECLAFISRLGSTWLSACIRPETEEIATPSPRFN